MSVDLVGQIFGIPFEVSGQIYPSWNPFIYPIAIILAACISAAIAAWTWRRNEESKRIFNEYKRKERMYSGLIDSLRGFYIKPDTNSPTYDKIEEFIKQLDLCWMYCPDNVIKNAYEFINTVHTQTEPKKSEKEKEEAYGLVMLSIRNDLIKRTLLKETSLKASDFKHIKPNRPITQASIDQEPKQ